MKLTNEEVAKVFAMYLGCEVYDAYNDKTGKVIGMDLKKGVEVQHNTEWSLSISEVKLLLTPLSKISDEDSIEVAKLVGYGDIEDMAPMGRRYILRMYKEGFADCFTIEVHEFIKSKSYAVPLFFAPGHWANAKTAIELGIAIEKI